jgi:hypothetical protein
MRRPLKRHVRRTIEKALRAVIRMRSRRRLGWRCQIVEVHRARRSGVPQWLVLLGFEFEPRVLGCGDCVLLRRLAVVCEPDTAWHSRGEIAWVAAFRPLPMGAGFAGAPGSRGRQGVLARYGSRYPGPLDEARSPRETGSADSERGITRSHHRPGEYTPPFPGRRSVSEIDALDDFS